MIMHKITKTTYKTLPILKAAMDKIGYMKWMEPSLILKKLHRYSREAHLCFYTCIPKAS